MVTVTLVAVFIETIRSVVEPKIIILLVSACLTSLFILNYFICRYRIPTLLGNNQFFKWFTWFELGMVGYGVIRILGYFSTTPIRPWDTPSTIALLIFSLYFLRWPSDYMG
jgi:uncharacterized membrane protein